jgi:hypothetical protein
MKAEILGSRYGASDSAMNMGLRRVDYRVTGVLSTDLLYGYLQLLHTGQGTSLVYKQDDD